MPTTCCAPGCRSGYDPCEKQDGISFHQFPCDFEMRQKWISAIHRLDQKPSFQSRICSLHFRPADFVTERQDSNLTRTKNIGSQLKKKVLKKTAIPSVLPNLPLFRGNCPKIQKKVDQCKFTHGFLFLSFKCCSYNIQYFYALLHKHSKVVKDLWAPAWMGVTGPLTHQISFDHLKL